MFEEIPQRASSAFPSQRQAAAFFGVMLTLFLTVSLIACVRWPMPLSPVRKVAAGEYALGILLSAVFLARSRSASPESNQKRMIFLFVAVTLLHIVVDVMQ